ncbi:hypothetical protein E2I00_016475, partial [Balaenoptera physalus]
SPKRIAFNHETAECFTHKQAVLYFLCHSHFNTSAAEASVKDVRKQTFFSSQMITSGKPFRKALCQLMVLRGTMRGPILPMGRIQEPTGQDSKDTGKTAKQHHYCYYNYCCCCITNNTGFLSLDRGPLDHLDGFGGTFLSEMQEDSRTLWLTLRLHIIYRLKAILVLSDTQHELQAWSMEKRTLLQQRELVKSILEPNFKYPWNIPFTLDTKLLTTLQEEGVAVTFSLLEERSLRVAPDRPKRTGGLEAEKPLLALYGSCRGLSLPRGAQSREAWPHPRLRAKRQQKDTFQKSLLSQVSRSEPIHLREMVAGAVTGGVSVGTGLQGSVAGSGVVSRSSALAVQTLRAPPNTWETLVEKSSASPPAHTPRAWQETEHSAALVPQGAAEPQGEGEPVCGDEAVEAAEDATLQSLSRGDGAGRLEGRVLSPQWEGDELEKPGPGCGEKDGTASGWAPGEEPDFRGLQRQARAQLQDLATLPPELRDPLLGALQELLQDPWALQELEDTLEQALDTGVLGQLGGPGGLLLIILRDPSGSLSPSKGRAILCILGALVGGEHLRARLQPDGGNNLLPPTGRALVPAEDVALTRSLVEGCELEPQGPAANSPGTWCHSCLRSTCPSQGCSCWPPPALQPSGLMPEKGATSSPRVPATLPPGSCWPGASVQGREAAAPPAATGDWGAPRDRLTHPLLSFTGWPPDFSCLSTSEAGGTS